LSDKRIYVELPKGKRRTKMPKKIIPHKDRKGEDFKGHFWVKTGKCIPPYICKKCGVTSGSNEAYKTCEGEKKEPKQQKMKREPSKLIQKNRHKAVVQDLEKEKKEVY